MKIKNPNKIKLLKLYEILRQETDVDHPLTTAQLLERLADCGIPCDRRTLSKDIHTLNDNGFEVMPGKKTDNYKTYYVGDRSFSLAELKILIDAVQAAAFIPDKMTKDLIDKISSMGGSHEADLLKTNLVCFNTRKHNNTKIYYNVEELEKAIHDRKKVSFFYFDLDENGEKKYRKNKTRYVAEPSALIYNDDNYYLMCWSPQHEEIRNYRVDRMETVQTEKEAVSDKAIIQSTEVADYTEQAFKMYTGEECAATLQFENSLIGVVYDKFGEDTKMNRIDENTCSAEVTVQISPTFWGWLLQFPGRMHIVSPNVLLEKYQNWLRTAIEPNEDSVLSLYEQITCSLIQKGLQISTMESCTSGTIASLITDTEGSSAVMKGSAITYSNEAKIAYGVPENTITKSGVYSEETAAAMASTARLTYKADIGIGVTGSFGNIDPANPDSVPGEIYFAIVTEKETRTFFHQLPPLDSRHAYKVYTAELVGKELYAAISCLKA